MDAPDEPAAPWYLRVVPMSLLGLALVVTAVMLVPGFRDELRLSTSRRPADLVELYFDQPMETGAQTACLRKGASVRLRFVVGSHVDRRLVVPYRVELDPLGTGLQPRRARGRAVVPPGQALHVGETLTLPAGEGFVAHVRLPSLGEQLRLRCPGVAR